ncbi:hypothetical protein TNCV_1881111 [Trichonephila clavipes]|nr:hypothetical protein TNCV_1881111 [Trichonephila clavipes]
MSGMSRVLVLVPIKTYRVERHLKSVEAQNSPVGVVWSFGGKGGGQLRCSLRHWTEIQNDAVGHQKA